MLGRLEGIPFLKWSFDIKGYAALVDMLYPALINCEVVRGELLYIHKARN
jgi:hypothetical protein